MPDITPKQEAVLERMPDTRKSIAEDLDISIRSVRYRQDALEDKGYEFERDSDGVWHEVTADAYEVDESESFESEEDTNDFEPEEPQRINSYDKAQITKDVHNELTDMEKEIKEALNNAKPDLSSIPIQSNGSSTLVMPHSDSHVGAIVRGRRDIDYYAVEEAKDNIIEYFDECISAAEQRGDVEDVVLIFNGDHLDGEGVYASQRHEQEDNLRDQLRKAGNLYIEQILRLSRAFDTVSVYCVPGNHGNIDKSSTTNADMMMYDFIETALSYAEADNINFKKAGPAGNVMFNVRGWKYFCRHGENYLKHVGTSSGIRRVLEWKDSYDFDISIRSHFHSVKYEPVGNEDPVIMTGSTAPPSTFAESKGKNGGECGVYWFTTEDNVIEDFQPIRVNN